MNSGPLSSVEIIIRQQVELSTVTFAPWNVLDKVTEFLQVETQPCSFLMLLPLCKDNMKHEENIPGIAMYDLSSKNVYSSEYFKFTIYLTPPNGFQG